MINNSHSVKGFWNKSNESKKNIHQFFCDNFNTPGVVTSVLELIKKTYEYHDKCEQKKSLKLHLVYGVAKYISDILKCLGLVYNTEFVDYFRLSESDGGKNAEEILTSESENEEQNKADLKDGEDYTVLLRIAKLFFS